MKVPYIPEDAPFSEDQRSWLSGFLAGLHSRIAIGDNQVVANGAAAVQAKPIDIVYGTQTGNSEDLANEAATLAKSKGYKPRVVGLDDVSMD
ncbi:MAG: flavodoxin domain-containing protein, partial [Planctomycetota bacterium]